jgi:hypothetical protein
MMARARLSAIALAALLMAPMTMASEVGELRGSDLWQRCQADPAYCRGVIDGAAVMGAWNDATFGCLLDLQNPITFAELRISMIAHFEQNGADSRPAHFLIEESMAETTECSDWRKTMSGVLSRSAK